MRTITHFVPRTPVPGETVKATFVTEDSNGDHYMGMSDDAMEEERFETLVGTGVFRPVEPGPMECFPSSTVTIGSSGTVMLDDGVKHRVRIGRVDRVATDRTITLTHMTNKGNPGPTFDVRVADVNRVV